ncbi:retrovirus-related Pol polyprotein from transposon 17.6 [Trichonephila clavipes]|nr:retrovirus-related Pol polyprotein from transposon 17.6 [Trichonephila clavipes]
MTATSTNTSAAIAEKINIQHLIPRFVKNSDISTYLKIFERQCEQVNMVLIKNNLKLCGRTELNNYLEGWLHSLEVKDLRRPLRIWFLPISLKKRVLKQVKEHFVDIWGDIKSSSELVQKLDDNEIAQGKALNHKVLPDGDPAHFGILRINSLSPSNRNAVLRISINGASGTAFADSGASHSIAGETRYTILLPQEAAFEKTVIYLHPLLMEPSYWKAESLTPFIILPDAKNNSTLLGVDFLENAGISSSVNIWPVAINNCQLREDKGQELLGSQCAELDSLLKNHQSIFEAGGKATPFIEHSINTENKQPISRPPYRMNPARKELLKKELNSLLQQGIIVECESPYTSPVVLIPKPNGSMHLCIDYRKLNTQTVPDSYPLPWMDDLLNEVKSTPYMSTIDLR